MISVTGMTRPQWKALTIFAGMLPSCGALFAKAPELVVADNSTAARATIALQNQRVTVRTAQAPARWLYRDAVMCIALLTEQLAMFWRRDFGAVLRYFAVAFSIVNQSVKRGSTQTGSGRQVSRLLFVGFMLLSFLFQSYATQSHIHFAPEVSAAVVVNIAAGKITASQTAPVRKNAPSNDNPDNCPLCQLLYGGQYVAPDALVFFLPQVAVSTIEIALGVTPHYDAVSHSWRGRAPPQS
jgi:hypothetical protein